MLPKKRRATTSTRTTKQSKVRKMPDSSSRPSKRATRPVKEKQPPRPIPAACATTPPQPLDEREGFVINPQPGASVVGASGNIIDFAGPDPDTDSLYHSDNNFAVSGQSRSCEFSTGLSFGEQVQVSRPVSDASIFDPIGMHVPQAIKSKIWAGQYIDLPLLLKQARDLRTEPHVTGELVIRNGQITIEKQQLKTINSIHTWTTAFMIYMSIFLEKSPHKGQELLKYMHNIRLAANRSGHSGWAKYDEQFRLKKERHPTLPWGVVDSELWVMHISSPQSAQSNQIFDSENKAPFRNNFSRKPQATQGPNSQGGGYGSKATAAANNTTKAAGVCFAFNRGSCSFNPCRFRHRCSACGGPHPQANCPQ
ncbi:uncharacterized protein LOC125668030 [Ostrea edulis]|uniref:uncharacterized protein LOC125668030 n=1 Tax=Ostrea edulis TaxID=37623 RepID=UPI0024AFB5E1|nr:uncharacterized protein LOC125668030 [Ostrea edulis]